MADKKIPRAELSPEELAKVHASDKARRERDKERILARQREWYQKNIDRMRPYYAAKAKEHAPRYKERATLSQKLYRAKNKERLRLKRQAREEAAHVRDREAARRWRAAHLARARANYAAWAQANPEKVRANCAKRRARVAGAPINDFTAKEWCALCKATGYRCSYCDKKFPFKELQQDHITPLSKGGSHTLANIMPACRFCNGSKHDRAVLKPVQPFLLIDDSAAD
jgi:5-methylcytosine-specific restriction endonuclease McrA